MIDHLGTPVSDLARSRRFYEQALRPPGDGVFMELDGALGRGVAGKPDFRLAAAPESRGLHLHVAFAAADRATVDALHTAAS